MTSIEPPRKGTLKVLQHLDVHGWVSLRSMGVLLGYKNSRSIYQRQAGANPIPTVRVGHIERVYEDDVIAFLDENNADHAEVLRYYKGVKKTHE